MKQFENIAGHVSKRISALDVELARIKRFHPEIYRRALEEVSAEELELSVKATLAIEGIFV